MPRCPIRASQDLTSPVGALSALRLCPIRARRCPTSAVDALSALRLALPWQLTKLLFLVQLVGFQCKPPNPIRPKTLRPPTHPTFPPSLKNKFRRRLVNFSILILLHCKVKWGSLTLPYCKVCEVPPLQKKFPSPAKWFPKKKWCRCRRPPGARRPPWASARPPAANPKTIQKAAH